MQRNGTHMLQSLLLGIAFILQVNGCSSSVVEPEPTPLATGVWANTAARFEVTDDGGNIVFFCAAGSIDQQILVNPDGQFEATGTMVSGPLAAPRRPVRFEGTVVADSLNLTIIYTDTREQFGVYDLIKDFDSNVGYVCVR